MFPCYWALNRTAERNVLSLQYERRNGRKKGGACSLLARADIVCCAGRPAAISSSVMYCGVVTKERTTVPSQGRCSCPCRVVSHEAPVPVGVFATAGGIDHTQATILSVVAFSQRIFPCHCGRGGGGLCISVGRHHCVIFLSLALSVIGCPGTDRHLVSFSSYGLSHNHTIDHTNLVRKCEEEQSSIKVWRLGLDSEISKTKAAL
ncbi:hypothetical protein B0T26DRAFT_708792 [Lasiosphaeria miniovina]|uniref:Uncharacterized protein n=1 Tax=Lasiosphaeria miniovina TaxID=1954250 RepID=A0AA40DZG8_9PEZI|nr:uncharacterized protein B0T26DRAFT_708792 [Lasiosphaeria miniovina]KAK0717168.1 hypothetical protein B0T26DRAFT_708792 [Lasiosphaeria miniovina]